MAKRKLSLQQRRRIAEQRAAKKALKAADVELPDDSSLGPACEGVIVTNFGSQVLVESGEHQQRCYIRANLELVTGDSVSWRPGSEMGVIESRNERTSELQRPDSYGKLRTVAANVSQVLITIASEPEPHASLIDRYLVAANLHGIDACILINKDDIQAEDAQAAKLKKIIDVYSTLDIPIIRMSVKTHSGEDALKARLKDHTSIFVGQSGVGKSSLVKMLLPEQEIRVGELSEGVSKGRHTTTHSQLFRFPFGGYCIDSPGIREFGLWHASPDDILEGFPEIYARAQECKFRDCAHDKEPGCAIQNAIDEGKIQAERYASFKLILDQLDDVTIKTQTGLKTR